MTAKEFIEQFNQTDQVVLLIGKRDVKPLDAPVLVQLGRWLAMNLPQATFRSGNASGADSLFIQGVASVTHAKIQIFAPYTSHRPKKEYKPYLTGLDQVNLANEPMVTYGLNTSNGRLVQSYLNHEENKLSAKGAYILRDCWMVFGDANRLPANVTIAYDDLSAPNQGGTGFTIQLCINKRVQVIKQNVWMGWLNENIL
jgi:hypothetical protein